MASETTAAIDFQLLSFTNINGLALANVGVDGAAGTDDVDVWRVGNNNIVDFAHSPTVNGEPLSTGGSGSGIVTNATVQIARNGADTGAVVGGQIQLDLDAIPTVATSYSATSTNVQTGVTVAQAIAANNPTGIQRITTSLPNHSYRVVNSATETYWLVIETDTAVASDISVFLHGEALPAANFSKSGASNLHLGVGENLFTFTLGTNQRNAWNANTHSATPGVSGFEIRDGNTLTKHLSLIHIS